MFVRLTPNDTSGFWHLAVDQIKEFATDDNYTRANFARVVLKDGTSRVVQESAAQVSELIKEATR